MAFIVNRGSPECGKYDTDECNETCQDYGTWKCLWDSNRTKILGERGDGMTTRGSG